MKIRDVYISTRTDAPDALARSNYQMLANYLSLAISRWLTKQRVDLGPFNRIVFEEDAADDLQIVGDRAFIVRLADEFPGFSAMQSSTAVHGYFTRKYLEGFARLDRHYRTSLTGELREFLQHDLADAYKFEKELFRKRVDKTTYVLSGVYTFDAYRLVLTEQRRGQAPSAGKLLYTAPADPIVVRFHVDKIEIDGSTVSMFNKMGKQEFSLPLKERSPSSVGEDG